MHDVFWALSLGLSYLAVFFGGMLIGGLKKVQPTIDYLLGERKG